MGSYPIVELTTCPVACVTALNEPDYRQNHSKQSTQRGQAVASYPGFPVFPPAVLVSLPVVNSAGTLVESYPFEDGIIFVIIDSNEMKECGYGNESTSVLGASVEEFCDFLYGCECYSSDFASF